MQNVVQFGIINIIFCTFLGFLIGPLINNIGYKFNILDIPDARKINKYPIVRIGGTTILISFFFGLFINPRFFSNPDFFIFDSQYIFTLLGGAFLYFLLGLHDDIFRSSPILRLIIQTLIAIWVTFCGINISTLNISIPFVQNYNLDLPIFFVYLLTSFWIVGITNAINWLDGFDGLAGGFCSIISFGLSIHMFNIGRTDGLIFFSILTGSTIGFLLRNFKPSFYIMGDCGSYFLGFCLSAGSVYFSTNLDNNSTSILYLGTLFSLPILDMTFVVIKRFINNFNPFRPDSNHLHHRLIRANLDYKSIIFLIYFYTILSVFLSYNFLNK